MNAQVISFHCILKNKLGSVLSKTFNQDVMTYEGAQQDVLKGLVKGLSNLKPGERRRIALSAQEAYGFYDPSKVVKMKKSALPKTAQVHLGDSIILHPEAPKPQLYHVAEIGHDYVVFDGNHPLAGQDLIFEIEATDARPATPEEILESFGSAENTTRVLH